MPSWVVQCSNCKSEFVHSAIADEGNYLSFYGRSNPNCRTEPHSSVPTVGAWGATVLLTLCIGRSRASNVVGTSTNANQGMTLYFLPCRTRKLNQSKRKAPTRRAPGK